MRRIVFSLVGLIFFLGTLQVPGWAQASDPVPPEPAPASMQEGIREAVDRAIERVFPALVQIQVVTVQAVGGRLMKFQGSGSGVIISSQGHVITNHHVAGKAKHLVCRMPDGREINARLVGTDPLADIAVVQLDLDPSEAASMDLPIAIFGDSDLVRVGDPVFAMGSPVGISQSVTSGIISNVAMIIPDLFWPYTFKLDGEEVGTLVRWIGHDAPISPGNSGGPLVNLDGEIIGLNEIDIGLGGAIPSNLAASVAEQIMATGEVRRSWTGLECQPMLKNSPLASGILVGGVVENSPASRAGLRPGDVILEYDGVPVDCRIEEDLAPFNWLVLTTPVGKTIRIAGIQDGRERIFSLTTEAREPARSRDKELKAWGITVRDLTRMAALERHRSNKQGVLVHTVRPGGACSSAKPPIFPGDVILEVNGEPVHHVRALREMTQRLVGEAEETVPVLVRYDRKGEQRLTVVKVGREALPDEPYFSRKAWLPAATQVLTRDLAEALGVPGKPGVRVTQIYPGHSAESAGMQVGDLLIGMDGEPIEAFQPEDVEVLPHMVRQYKIGSEATFQVLRNGEAMDITVELESPPTPASELRRYKDETFELTVRELSFRDRVSKRLEEKLEGVLIEAVENAGWAALARVAIGDILISIDGEPTTDPDTVERILNEAADEKRERLTFFVRRGIHTMYLEVELSWDNGNGHS